MPLDFEYQKKFGTWNLLSATYVFLLVFQLPLFDFHFTAISISKIYLNSKGAVACLHLYQTWAIIIIDRNHIYILNNYTNRFNNIQDKYITSLCFVKMFLTMKIMTKAEKNEVINSSNSMSKENSYRTEIFFPNLRRAKKVTSF